jgi:hypothetical protein
MQRWMMTAHISAALLAVTQAHATPNFPAAIQGHLGIAVAPQCSLCHSGGQTGRGTVNTPFGATMRTRGLVAYDEGALRTALDALAAERKDSDRDGTPDIEELFNAQNPNLGTRSDGGVEAEPLVPVYGCASIGPEHGPSGLVLAALVACTFLRARRRRPG